MIWGRFEWGRISELVETLEGLWLRWIVNCWQGLIYDELASLWNYLKRKRNFQGLESFQIGVVDLEISPKTLYIAMHRVNLECKKCSHEICNLSLIFTDPSTTDNETCNKFPFQKALYNKKHIFLCLSNKKRVDIDSLILCPDLSTTEQKKTFQKQCHSKNLS